MYPQINWYEDMAKPSDRDRQREADRWRLAQIARSARGSTGNRLLNAARGTWARSVDVATRAADAARSRYAKPPDPQEQCC